MKKKAKVLLSILMVILIFLTVVSTMSTKAYAFLADDFVVGDVNCDNEINVDDAVGILQHYAKTAAGISESVTEELYDVNCDNEINVDDAILLLQYYAKKAAGHSDIEWPPARYEFGQVVQYDSTQSLYMLYDESGKCMKFLTNGDVFTVLKSVGNNKYMISYDAGIYYIKIENYNSFVYLYDVRHFTYMSFYTYPDIGDIAFWYNGVFVIPLEVDDSGENETISLGDTFAILEKLGRDKYRIMKENGRTGTVIMELDDFCKSMYKMTPQL